MSALGCVLHIFLVAVGFPLERDTAISLMCIKVAQRQADKVLYDVPQVEEHTEHFNTLLCVDALVVQRYIGETFFRVAVRL